MQLVIIFVQLVPKFCAVSAKCFVQLVIIFVHLVVKFCATTMAVAELGGGSCQNGELSAT